MAETEHDLTRFIRTVQDFPTSGIDFKDISPLLADAHAFSQSIEMLADYYRDKQIEYVAGIEARGFLIAAALSLQLEVGLLPIRKSGKLPGPVFSLGYELEYGSATLELQKGCFSEGSNILIVDDVLATGGTAECAAQLVNLAGGKIAGFGFLISLDFLAGRKRIAGYEEVALVRYD